MLDVPCPCPPRVVHDPGDEKSLVLPFLSGFLYRFISLHGFVGRDRLFLHKAGKFCPLFSPYGFPPVSNVRMLAVRF